LGGEGPEKQIDAKGVELGRRSHGGRRWRADSDGESSSEIWGGAGEVDDKVRKVLVEGIDERRPEQGDRWEGGRRDELSSARWRKERERAE